MDFGNQTALRLAKACQWAYDFEEDFEGELLEFEGELPTEQEIQIFDSQRIPTSFAGVVEYSDVVILAFQGTITEFGRDGEFRMDSLIDWVQNFKVELISTEQSGLPGRVHEGFLGQLDLVYETVVDVLRTSREKPILVTGHSQGGAVATLATRKLIQDGFNVEATYTFGAPKAGDARFAKSIKSPLFRVEFGNDVVPHVPPSLKSSKFFGNAISVMRKFVDLPDTLLAFKKLTNRISQFGYAATGRLVYGSPNQELLVSPDAKTESKLNSQRRKSCLLSGKKLLRHHGIANYISLFR